MPILSFHIETGARSPVCLVWSVACNSVFSPPQAKIFVLLYVLTWLCYRLAPPNGLFPPFNHPCLVESALGQPAYNPVVPPCVSRNSVENPVCSKGPGLGTVCSPVFALYSCLLYCSRLSCVSPGEFHDRLSLFLALPATFCLVMPTCPAGR